MATVPGLFRLLLMLVAVLAHGFVIPDLFSLQLHRPWFGHRGVPWYMDDQCMRTTPRKGSRHPRYQPQTIGLWRHSLNMQSSRE